VSQGWFPLESVSGNTSSSPFVEEDEAMWLSAPNLHARHGFSQRRGGISQGAYADLNLSQNVGDDADHVTRNRQMALEALGLNHTRLARLRQVHSSEVVTVTRDSDTEHLPMADALVTALEGVTLVIETADCYPVLLEDATAGVVEDMTKLGAHPERIRGAIGPGICAERYVVSADVIARFAENQFPEHSYLESVGDLSKSGIEQFQVNLERANTWVLTESGVFVEHIWVSGRCSSEDEFFSHRRDQGKTGRMWSVIVKG
jgi:polyphenol oxidase